MDVKELNHNQYTNQQTNAFVLFLTCLIFGKRKQEYMEGNNKICVYIELFIQQHATFTS